MNRQKLLLAILLILFALAVLSIFWRTPSQKRVATLKYQKGSVAERMRTQASALGDDKKVHLELLDKGKGRFAGFRRNIFRPIFREEGKPSAFIPERPSLPVAPPQISRPAPPLLPPEPQPTPLQRDMAQFTFLGFLKKEGVKTIFLSKDNEIFLVKKGDRIAGKYTASVITEEALTIRVEDGGEIIMPLVENRQLAAPRQ